MNDLGAPSAEIRFFSTAAVFYFILAVGGVLWIGLDRGRLTMAMFVDLESVVLDIVIGLAAAVVLLASWRLAHARLESVRALETKIVGLLHGVSPAEAVALALISGFSEELFFRGAVQGSFGWLWATAIFAVMHTGSDRGFGLWTLFALVAGAAFAWMTEIRQTLLPAIVGHTAVNAVQLVRLARRAAAEPQPP